MRKLAIFHPANNEKPNENTQKAAKVLEEKYEICNLLRDINSKEDKHAEFMELIRRKDLDGLLGWYGGNIKGNGSLTETIDDGNPPNKTSDSSWELVEALSDEDWKEIKESNPVLIGRSDLTMLLSAFINHGILCYYGPNLQSGFAEAKTEEDAKLMMDIMSGVVEGRIHQIDFSDTNLCQGSETIVIREGKATGRLIGGNLSTIADAIHFKLTDAIPERKPGDIILLENAECHYFEEVDLRSFNCLLMDQTQYKTLKEYGWLDNISALILGRGERGTIFGKQGPMDFSPENEVKALTSILDYLEVGQDIPVLANVCCSHTEPMATLPLGKEVTVDTSTSTVSW